MTTQLTELFDSNRRWARDTEAHAPGFFSQLQLQQTPQYLRIGCAVRRVPAHELGGPAYERALLQIRQRYA